MPQVACKLMRSNPRVHVSRVKCVWCSSVSLVEVKTVKMVKIKIFPVNFLPFLPPTDQNSPSNLRIQ